jgi:NitT/TauT family transport system ATP-binding protein
MVKLFPLNTLVGEIRGIIEIIKDNGGKIEMSSLSRETNDDIDDLFPLLDTCTMLDLATISKGVVKLTQSGTKLASYNTRELFSQALQKAEPFKSTLTLVSRSGLTTDQLASRLSKKGISFHSDGITNREVLKNLLLKWGVQNHLLHYDAETDIWSKYKQE